MLQPGSTSNQLIKAANANLALAAQKEIAKISKN